jgi:hypothetical protein
MTAQIPDHLDNDHPTVEFGELSLYGVIVGDITANYGWGSPYPFQNHPTAPGEEIFSALWRGYIADFRLSPGGTLTLIAFHYPLALGKPTVQVNERLEGNFWLVMKSHFEGNRVYIPFEAGMLVTDEQQWVIENREALEILKHPPPAQRFTPQNIVLDSSIFIGFIQQITTDTFLEEYLWVVFNQDIPRANSWCKVQIIRDEKIIARTAICGSSGGLAGPWMLRPPFDVAPQIGDSVFAVERLPTNAEIEAQIASLAT